MEHAEKTRSKDARKVVHDFLCVVKKIGASEDTITKEEQNQMRVKPSKPFKKVSVHVFLRITILR